MNPLVKMAWLNIWRNRRRAFILLCAMTAGLVGILFTLGFMQGWVSQMVSEAVGTYEGHIKIFARGYNDNPVVEKSFVPDEHLQTVLAGDPRIRSWVARVAVQGLISTPEHSRVVTLIGTDPLRERDVSTACRELVAGRFLAGENDGDILLGRELSEKIGKGPGKKVVLMSQQLDGEIGTAAFRVAGVFNAGSGSYNEGNVYVALPAVQQMLALNSRVTEVAILLHDIRDSETVAADLTARLHDPGLEVLTWRQRLPYIHEMLAMMAKYTWPYYAIFYLAMAFGVVNTLMMSIGERLHEIGVLLAVGMTRRRLVGLIMLESFFIALVAIVAGLAAGGALVGWFAVHGIDLSAWSEGMDLFGVAHVIRPALQCRDFLEAAAGTFAVSVFFSLLPAWRAARLAPVVALRKTG